MSMLTALTFSGSPPCALRSAAKRSMAAAFRVPACSRQAGHKEHRAALGISGNRHILVSLSLGGFRRWPTRRLPRNLLAPAPTRHSARQSPLPGLPAAGRCQLSPTSRATGISRHRHSTRASNNCVKPLSLPAHDGCTSRTEPSGSFTRGTRTSR